MTLNFGAMGDGLQKIGSSLMQTATFYGRAKMALHNSGGGCCGNSVWTQGCMYPGMATCSPMALNSAYMQGYMMMQQALARATLSTPVVPGISPTTGGSSTPAADAVSSSQDTSLGSAFEVAEKTGGVLDFSKSEMAAETDATKKQEIYKNSLQNVAKSLLMNIDKTSGDSNGYITAAEFLKHETANMTEDEKRDLTAGIQQAFSQMDLNGDGKLDWKELTAAVSVYDADGDGEITKDEFNKTGTSIAGGNAATSLKTAYQKLFGTGS